MSSNWSASANSAFGSRASTSGGQQKRAADAAYQLHQQREAQQKRAEEAKEAKHLAEAMNFASSDAYPSLGAPMAPKAAPAMNFSKTVAAMAAKAKADEAAAAAKAAAEAAEYKAMHPASYVTRRAAFRMPEAEMDGELDGYESEPQEEYESEGEFNADLGDTRRRGDKGIW